MFVRSKEFDEFIYAIQRFWKLFKKYPIHFIIGAIIFYIVIVSLIVIFP